MPTLLAQALNTYKVSLTTSDLRGSDFEGEAFITLSGYNGTTEEMRLVQQGRSKSSFVRGETATFTVRGVDVSYVYSVTVRMVGSGQGVGQEVGPPGGLCWSAGALWKDGTVTRLFARVFADGCGTR